jgi:uncharacterized membrane protein YeaQ/YmgE (transglycosylase-associated protein family)
MTFDQILTLFIVGALAGTIAGVIVRRKKEGFGKITNVIVGVIGAVLGGGLLRLLEVELNWGKVTLQYQDLLAAFVGSLLFLIVIGTLRKSRGKKKSSD